MNTSETAKGRYTLIYGLSANPVHQGHIDLVIGAVNNLQHLNYDIVQTLIIPVYRRNPVGNPKDNLPNTYSDRVNMCELAAQEVRTTFPDMIVDVSQIEAYLSKKSNNPNYTADTLSYIKNHAVNSMDLIFLISSELVSGEYPEFDRWYRTDTILKTASLAVCPRPGFPINMTFIKSLRERGGRLILLESVETPDISSTSLRLRLSNGENPYSLAQEGAIPISIAQLIYTTNLYQNPNANSNGSKRCHPPCD